MKRRLWKQQQWTCLGLTALLLSACGGGGSGGGGSTPPPPNEPPTADAGADQAATENTAVSLSGQGNDPDGDAITYAWSQVSGPGVAFSATDSADVTVMMPAVAVGEQEDVVLRLTVTDSNGASANDDVSIAVSSTDFVIFRAEKDEDGKTELYKYDPESDTVIKLSAPLVAFGNVDDFSLSPDGLFVAYRADQEVDNRRELYVAATDGSGVTKVSAALANALGDVRTYQWSPDGSQIVYTADADIDSISEVYLADRDGANHRKINGGTAGMVELVRVQWSPDGRYIAQEVRNLAFGRALGINIHDTTTGSPNSTRITNVPDLGELSIVTVNGVSSSYRWSPDSTRVAYIADQDADEVFELYTAFADDSANPKINGALTADGDVFDFEWSPDGTRIAYRADQDADGVIELYSVMADGSGVVKLNGPLIAGGDVNHFRWAPDGSRILYQADQDTDNVFELYTVMPDGTDLVKVSGPMVAGGDVGVSYFSTLEWSPDSQWIAYHADRETNDVFEVYVSAADGSSTTKVSGPMVGGGEIVYLGRDNYLWAPDSGSLAYIAYQLSRAFDLFVADINATTNPQINRMPMAGGALTWFGQWAADGSRLIYSARQDSADVNELYMATPDGMSNVKISGPLVSGGLVSVDYTWYPSPQQQPAAPPSSAPRAPVL